MSLADRFFENAERYPERPALRVAGTEYSYGTLAELALQIAGRIAGVTTPGTRAVGLMAHRSVDAYAGVLGILRAGLAYMPLSPRFPPRRNAIMLDRSRVESVVIDPDRLAEFLPVLQSCDPPLNLIVLDSKDTGELVGQVPELRIAGPGDPPPRPGSSGDDLAYIMFTSGTTGGPKGVGITHTNALTYVHNLTRRLDFAPSDRFSQTFDLTFDLSVHDLFVCWSVGGCLCVLPEKDLALPGNFIKRQKITSWFSVPSMAGLLNRMRMLKPNVFRDLRFSLFCGEGLPAALAEAWQRAAPQSLLENLYGPTEATIAFTAYRWTKDQPGQASENGLVPIGQAWGGQLTAIVDESLRPVPAGASGELLLAGAQVAPGYLDDPEETAQRFVTLELQGEAVRWYRTGDLAREDPEVGLIFLGRTDTQIKVKGHRIELAEVEQAVREAVGADFAVALPWPVGPDGVGGVVAFVAACSRSLDSALELVAQQLPPYMVPSRLIEVDRLPLNANGKIDRSALRARLEEEEQ